MLKEIVGVTKAFYEETIKGPWENGPMDTQYRIVIEENTAYLFLQCTASCKDIITDLKCWLKEQGGEKRLEGNGNGYFKSHAGVAEVVQGLFWNVLWERFSDWERYGINKIVISGYSLGATITVALMEMIKRYLKRWEAEAYAFAPFKYFGFRVPKHVKERLKNLWLIHVRGDIVWLHPFLWFYRHVAGHVVKLGKFRFPCWKYHNPSYYTEELAKTDKLLEGVRKEE